MMKRDSVPNSLCKLRIKTSWRVFQLVETLDQLVFVQIGNRLTVVFLQIVNTPRYMFSDCLTSCNFLFKFKAN